MNDTGPTVRVRELVECIGLRTNKLVTVTANPTRDGELLYPGFPNPYIVRAYSPGSYPVLSSEVVFGVLVVGALDLNAAAVVLTETGMVLERRQGGTFLPTTLPYVGQGPTAFPLSEHSALSRRIREGK